LGCDFILFEKAFDGSQLLLRSQTRMKFLKCAVIRQALKAQKPMNNTPDLQCTLSDLVEHLRRSNFIRVNGQGHESVEQLVNIFHHPEASVLLKLRGLEAR
jgi:hypothetical protein